MISSRSSPEVYVNGTKVEAREIRINISRGGFGNTTLTMEFSPLDDLQLEMGPGPNVDTIEIHRRDIVDTFDVKFMEQTVECSGAQMWYTIEFDIHHRHRHTDPPPTRESKNYGLGIRDDETVDEDEPKKLSDYLSNG